MEGQGEALRPAAQHNSPEEQRFQLRWEVDSDIRSIDGKLALSILEDQCLAQFNSHLQTSTLRDDKNQIQDYAASRDISLNNIVVAVVERLLIKAGDAPRRNDAQLIKRIALNLLDNEELKANLWHCIEKSSTITTIIGKEDEPDKPIDYASLIPLPQEGWITVGRCGHWKDCRIEATFNKR